MARVYSAVLWEWPGASAGNFFSDPVPDGFLWVVREIEVALLFNADNWGLGGLQMYTNSGAPLFNVAGTESMFQHDYHKTTRQVMVAGDNIGVTTFDDNWCWRISGYQLSLP